MAGQELVMMMMMMMMMLMIKLVISLTIFIFPQSTLFFVYISLFVIYLLNHKIAAILKKL